MYYKTRVSEGVVNAFSLSSQEQWPWFTLKLLCLCSVFYKGLTSTMLFHCQALISVERVSASAPLTFQEGKGKNCQLRSEVSGFRDLNTRLKAWNLVWTRQVKTKWSSVAILLLPKSLLFKKPFREHIGITWNRRLLSWRTKYREGNLHLQNCWHEFKQRFWVLILPSKLSYSLQFCFPIYCNTLFMGTWWEITEMHLQLFFVLKPKRWHLNVK